MKLNRLIAMLLCLLMVTVLFAGCAPKEEAPPSGQDGAAAQGSQDSADGADSAGDAEDAGDTGDAPASGEVVKFGLIAPLNGSNAEFGTTYQTAVEMAVDEINANGGVNGRMLEVTVYDSQGDASKSVDVCRKLCDDPEIVAILGDYSSSCCMANAPIVEEAGIMMCSGGASNPAYCVINDYCFSINGREDVEAPYFCKYLIGKYLGCERLGVLWINTDYGKGSMDIFEQEAAANGIEIVANESYVDGEADFSSIIAKVRSANPDTLLILDSSSSGAQILNQINQAGWDVQVANLGAGTSTQIIELAGSNANGLLTTGPFYMDESNAEIVSWFKEFESRAGYVCEFQGPVMRDATYMLAEAIAQCGDDITRQNVRDNFAALSFDGYTGHIEFEDDGSVARAYYIFQIEDGKWVEKAGLDYASK